jgi:tagaturonate reductase
MKRIKRKMPIKPVVVAQFGEGNFLRAFADYMIDIANEKGVFEGGVAVIKPIPFGCLDDFHEQENTYTVILRGLQDGRTVEEHRVISSISQVIDPFADYDAYLDLAKSQQLRFVISNTTEAGIVYDETDRFGTKPANSFPGKLTQFLFARYEHFSGDSQRGLVILPVELLDQNGEKLRECVNKLISLWELPDAFKQWVEQSCIFCSCLVDRIVSGYPADEAQNLQQNLLGYIDKLMVVGEPFGLWVIQSERHKYVQKLFPLDKAGMPVVFTDNLRPYRERKVRLLNGGHTAGVLAAYLYGLDTVGQAMANPDIRALIKKIMYDEVAPTVPLPHDEVTAFADSVIERFENPFIRHELLTISLNSVSKWKARVLPSLKDSFDKNSVLPQCLVFSLAALATFYRSQEPGEGCLIGRRGETIYEIRDDAHVLDFFAGNAGKPNSEFAQALLSNAAFWGEDLSKLTGMGMLITRCLDLIEQKGMSGAVREIVG